MKNVVILGGGTAGTMAANKLRAAVPSDELSITVVDRDDVHHYQPGYLFVPFGGYDTSDIVRSRHNFIHDGVQLTLSEIDRVDAEANTVHLVGGRTLPYDYLIIASGVSPRPDLVPGVLGDQYGVSIHDFYTLDGAMKLREALTDFKGGRMVVHISEMPIKCPVAPLEFTFLADSWLKSVGLRQRTEIVYVTPLDGAFTKPVASRELSHALSSRGIELVTDFAVERVEPEQKQIVSYDGRSLDYDLLVTIAPNQGQEYIKRSGLGDESNLVACDKHTMQSDAYPNIFVLGDAGTLPTSKAGSVAHFSVEIFTENFKQLLAGKPMTHSFDGHANCFIESGDGKGMLLDFNYDTEPLTGTFPFPGVGPMALLKESKANHWGKLAFKWIYWNLLLHGRPIGIPADMMMAGKHIEGAAGRKPGKVKAARPKPSPVAAPTKTAAPKATAPTPSGRVITTTILGRPIDVNEEGFLVKPSQWDDELGAELARFAGVDLTDRHWQVLRFLRADQAERGETPTLRRTATVGGFEMKELFTLFPGKPAKKMSYIAGLAKPKGCV